MATILVLNYHRIVQPNEQVDPLFKEFTLDEHAFRKQLETIQRLGIPVIDLVNAHKTNILPAFCIGITIDDGHCSDLTIAAPILQHYGFHATFFPVINHIGKAGFVTWDDLRSLQKMGFAIGSHSVSHQRLTQLNALDLQLEIEQSRSILEEKLGIPIQLFSVPYGACNSHIVRSIRSAGYLRAFSTVFGTQSSNDTTAFLWKRWNIKRSTHHHQFEQVLRQHTPTLFRLKTLARIKVNIAPLRMLFNVNH